MVRSAMPASAIVLGGNVNGLGVLRSLGRIGVRCGLVSNPWWGDHARHSKYVSVVKVIAEEADDVELIFVVREMADTLGSQKKVVLIPTTDRFSQFLSHNRRKLGDTFLLNCAPAYLDDAFLDKWKTAKICAENAVLIPATECPASETELAEVGESITYPVIVKPRYTFFQEFPGKNVIARDARELTDIFSRHAIMGDAIVQEIIPSGDGDIIAISAYSDRNGKVLASFCWRKLRQHLPDYGATCFGVSETHPELERANRRFLDKIGYKGFSMAEFARSRKDSRLYFLELNTRTAWANHWFADSGVDLTRLAFNDLTGGDVLNEKGKFEQRNGLFWLDLRRDRASMLIKRDRGEISLWGWLFSLAKARSFAHWSWHDPLPFIMACSWRIRIVFRRFVQSVTRDVVDT